MNKLEEYKALRNEILNADQIVKTYRSLLYTIVVASLAFAFDKEEPILYLLPFIAIIPIYLMAMHQIDSMIRIGTYIYVFIEPETECQWETRLFKYDNLYRNEFSTKKTRIDSYWYISISCIMLSILRQDYYNRDFTFYFTILLQIIFMSISTYLFIKKRPDYLLLKQKYIEDWKRIEKLELED